MMRLLNKLYYCFNKTDLGSGTAFNCLSHKGYILFTKNMDSFLMYDVLIDTQFNYTHAAQLYAERYPLQRHPSRRTFARFAQRIAAAGRFDIGKRNRIRPATNEEHV